MVVRANARDTNQRNQEQEGPLRKAAAHGGDLAAIANRAVDLILIEHGDLALRLLRRKVSSGDQRSVVRILGRSVRVGVLRSGGAGAQRGVLILRGPQPKLFRVAASLQVTHDVDDIRKANGTGLRRHSNQQQKAGDCAHVAENAASHLVRRLSPEMCAGSGLAFPILDFLRP